MSLCNSDSISSRGRDAFNWPTTTHVVLGVALAVSCAATCQSGRSIEHLWPDEARFNARVSARRIARPIPDDFMRAMHRRNQHMKIYSPVPNHENGSTEYQETVTAVSALEPCLSAISVIQCPAQTAR